MKIGVLTHWWSKDNYGQQLQCWALQNILRELGHDPYLIRYKPRYDPDRRRWLKLFNPCAIIRFIRRKISYPQPMPAEIIPRGLDEFRKKHIMESDCIYHSAGDLEKNPPDADAYIVGSDQVWSFSPQPNAAPWLLNFGESKVLRISYAASFGRGRLDRNSIRFFMHFLTNFDAISVRETEGVDICLDAGRDDAVHVLDPTLLLNQSHYETIAASAVHGHPFVLGYFLNLTSADEIGWPLISNYADSLKSTVFRVVPAHGVEAVLPPDTNFYYPRMDQFVSDCARCEALLTSSFHGMVMSIIFKRPFLVFTLKGPGKGMNGRITSLLDALGLSARVFDPAGPPLAKQLAHPINWAQVEANLAILRLQSIAFLSTSLVTKE